MQGLMHDQMGRCCCGEGRTVIATVTTPRQGQMAWRPGDRPGMAIRQCHQCAQGFLVATLASSTIRGNTIVSSNNCWVTHADLAIITRFMLDAIMPATARDQLRRGQTD